MNDPDTKKDPLAASSEGDRRNELPCKDEPHVNRANGELIPRERKPKDGKGRPWYIWQDRRAIGRIHDKLGTDAANGLAVYLVLTQISGEHRKTGYNDPTFQEKITRIAGMAGLRYKTTHKTLHSLADAGVISIQTVKSKGKTNAESFYTLLSFCIPPTAKNTDPLGKLGPSKIAERKTYNTEGVYKELKETPEVLPAEGGQTGVSEVKGDSANSSIEGKW